MTTTMDDLYGDSSKHEVCLRCGFCISCQDCDNFGCGEKVYEENVEEQRKIQINHRGQSES